MTTPQQYRLMPPGGSPMGPMVLDIVLELIKQGEVTQDYLFAKNGSEDWYPICKLPGIPAGALSPSSVAKTSFGQILACSLAATTIYTAISLLFSPHELPLTETSTWTVLVIMVGVASLLLALVALGVFRHINLPRIGREALLVVLSSFWFLPFLFLLNLGGYIDIDKIPPLDFLISILISALLSSPWPILLCFFNRHFDKKR